LSIVLPANLAEANKRADALALQLEQSENARKKAESNAAVIEDLRKRLHNAENSLSENITQQTAREEGIISRLEAQSRRFVSKCSNHYLFFAYPCFSWRAFFPDELYFCLIREDAARL
jgi:gamma-glutamylcysteine synthetase